ncbi:MAG: CHAD domain-containing protein [Actinomycetes bacterium]
MAKARPIPGLTGQMRYSDAATATIAVRSDELFDHAAGVLDVTQIEAVHAMRVATRRLRSVLEFYEPCLDHEQLEPILAQICELADVLGQRRDPDVELEALAGFAAAASEAERPGIERFIDRTSEQQQQANAELAQMIEQIKADDLRGRLAALIAPAPTAAAVDGPTVTSPAVAEETDASPVKSGWLRRR